MNAMRAALAPIPAEPWDALTAERRIADRAPTPNQKPLNLPSSLLRPPQPAAPSARANSRLNGSDLGVYTRFLATMPRRTPI
ncbi:hypothetical protein [Burkholderia multivorans]|uniref:hypothetical protein n=1 Tax=Burkholderia multivorans TaxID=87883 RepID=UPI001EE67EE8|nr:hypothetical protein [Burkholderia multivorans]